jgi:myo-inositol 2-dehydrogenase / D-chiro-inositol 1-dehydrogenase
VLSGARVTAVSDADADRAREVADALPGTSVHAEGEELIASPDVDAVLVCSWGPTHERYVLAALAEGKPVLCEKPLAVTRESCDRILDAEVALGRRLVQVGFMRRYDAAYRALHAAVHGGAIGAPLLMHAAHRNAAQPERWTSEMIINDSTVHDIDVARWLLDDEVAAVRVLRPRPNRRAAPGLADPLLVILEMASGVIVDVEASANIGFGYDIRGEVVGEVGTVELSESAGAIVKAAGRFSGRVPVERRERFVSAFDVEVQAWLDSVAAGNGAVGPSAWDGYAATVACDAGVAALRGGERVTVTMRERPKLYG